MRPTTSRSQTELDRDPTATGKERAAEALAARPTAEAKADAWAKAVERNDLSNQMVEAISAGFRRSADLSLLEPYVEKYHAMLVDAWAERSVAIGERVVGGFYPFSLASEQLKDASDAWLAANADAAPGLVRTVAENRDTIARALRGAGARPPRLSPRCGAVPTGRPAPRLRRQPDPSLTDPDRP